MTSTKLAAAAAFGLLFASGVARADDPFAKGADALAVKDSDGSGSVRAKLALKVMKKDMIMVRVTGVNDKKYPDCVLTAQVLKGAQSKAKLFKLLGRGKKYRFVPVLKRRGRAVDLRHKMTQNNLGACYYPARTKLVLRIKGIDKKRKAFVASEIYLK